MRLSNPARRAAAAARASDPAAAAAVRFSASVSLTAAHDDGESRNTRRLRSRHCVLCRTIQRSCLARSRGPRPQGIVSAGGDIVCLRRHRDHLITQLLHLRLHLTVRDYHMMQRRALRVGCDAPLCRLQTALDRFDRSAQLRATLPQHPQREARLDQSSPVPLRHLLGTGLAR